LRVSLLGPLTASRGGVALVLPASRKARALFAYLLLAPSALTRTQLCDLLWDGPKDPRGELRWCLSKIRNIADQPGQCRVNARSDTVHIELSDCFVDAIEITRAIEQGLEALDTKRLDALSSLFAGPFLDGLDIDSSPAFDSWLVAQRRRFRSCHAALLEHLVHHVDGEEVFDHLAKWLELAPFDRRVHEALLGQLARRGRVREGEEHLAVSVRLFEAEGLDHGPILDAWRAARAQADGSRLPHGPCRIPGAAAGQAAGSGIDRRDGSVMTPRRASIAVMPFAAQPARIDIAGGPADGLTHDVITRLAKLRSLFVLAQGSVFALGERRLGAEEAARMLNVDYVVSGSLQRQGGRLTVRVELAETRTARIVWAEVFDQKADDALLVLDEIGNRIVASIASEIETVERNRAILKPPSSLDAWEAYHRGLWHMYRFNRDDNQRARHFFETAVRLDRTFARAYAGLSFTHFQNAFQGWTPRQPAIERAFIERAFDAAGQSLMADDRDPAAHWAMGRALWLRGTEGACIAELEKAIDLSPNFALGHYTLAFVHSQAGDPAAAVRYSDQSRLLSPFDPLLFGMLGARAMALMRLGRFDEAADWGIKAAARPNAHVHIRAIAAYGLALAGRRAEARAYLASIHKAMPHYGVGDFLAAMKFGPEGVALFHQADQRIRLG